MYEQSRPLVALIYDFDGTLSPANMQEFGLIQTIGDNIDSFWRENRTLALHNDADDVLCYLYRILTTAQNKGIRLTREMFRQFGTKIELYEGVCEWFALINSYGESLNLDIRHYIISSGLKEMIEGSPIAGEFENIYACSYLYNDDGTPCWPAVAVDYTTKTQFIFKINKGIREVSDNKKVNQFVPDEQRPIPFSHMIYFGDGETDVPCMRMVKERGGHSIAIYGNELKKSTSAHLLHDNRVNFACPADYRKDSEIHSLVCTILKRIRADIDFDNLKALHHSRLNDHTTD